MEVQMDPAHTTEVFKRLGEKQARFLDERHQEMPLIEQLVEIPLFERKKGE
jgi:hypothetical protein